VKGREGGKNVFLRRKSMREKERRFYLPSSIQRGLFPPPPRSGNRKKRGHLFLAHLFPSFSLFLSLSVYEQYIYLISFPLCVDLSLFPFPSSSPQKTSGEAYKNGLFLLYRGDLFIFFTSSNGRMAIPYTRLPIFSR